MFSNELKNFLSAIPEVTNLIGPRLYPGWFPEKVVYPAVAFLAVSDMAHHDIAVAYPRYQFSCMSPRYLEAKAAANAIRDALQRFKGKMGDTRVIQVVWEGTREMHEPDTKIYHIATDFKIIYRE